MMLMHMITAPESAYGRLAFAATLLTLGMYEKAQEALGAALDRLDPEDVAGQEQARIIRDELERHGGSAVAAA